MRRREERYGHFACDLDVATVAVDQQKPTRAKPFAEGQRVGGFDDPGARGA